MPIDVATCRKCHATFASARGRANHERSHSLSLEDRFWARVQVRHDQTSCWEWQGAIDRDGYGRFNARLAGGCRGDAAHRVVWRMTEGPIPEGLQILHHCDNRKCVRPSHLYAGTTQDNTRDMMSRGRHRNGQGRLLSPGEVEAIRSAWRGGQTQRSLAAAHNVAHSVIRRVVYERTYPRPATPLASGQTVAVAS